MNTLWVKAVPGFICVLLLMGCVGSKTNPQPSKVSSRSFYGTGMGADSLANTPIGGPYGYAQSYRFRAQRSSPLIWLRPFFIWSDTKSGYQSGTGGTIQISLETDDGTNLHAPTGHALATLIYGNVLAGSAFPKLTFPTPVQITAGTLYHMVFRNADKDPLNNWVSLDSIYYETPQTPQQPSVSDLDWQQLMISSDLGTWVVRGAAERTVFTPTMELAYEDGFTQGYGYMEVWVGNPKPIGGIGNAGVRERFTLSGEDRTIESSGIRIRRISGSRTSPLILTLLDEGGGVLAKTEVGGSFIGSSYTWINAPFSSPFTLRTGQTYSFTLSAGSDVTFETYPIRDGSVGMPYAPDACFGDGFAQFNPGTGWIGWDQWGQSDRKDGDLQFYLGVVK